MEAGGAPERRPRRGPAPIASFDHDVSDESSPETKQTFRLPEIREDPAGAAAASGSDALAPPEQRARSHSSPAVHGCGAGAGAAGAAGSAGGGLQTPAAPRIDISRASSSSHHDSRDSSPELALFSGGGEEGPARLELGFREDGALELRSSTEELAFLEGGAGELRAAPAQPASRRHSRKDSQCSEAALLAVSGRTSRLSSVGSQCSAVSAFSQASRASHLSAVSGASRAPSPHKMLLETSFCGPKPIETDPEICAAAVEERLLEIAKLAGVPPPEAPPVQAPAAAAYPVAPAAASTALLDIKHTVNTDIVDARDHREVRTEVTVENARPAHAPRQVSPAAPCIPPSSPESCSNIPDEDKRLKESQNRARAGERLARSKERREPPQPGAGGSSSRSKDIIRIKLKPDHEYDVAERARPSGAPEPARKPASLELRAREAVGGAGAPPRPRDSRTPSPCGAPVSRKSSFCSLFKSRETVASPDSPSDSLRRKRSVTEARSRSKSRDRSTTPTSAAKIRGSVLSLFKTPKKSATSPSPSSRDSSPLVQPQRPLAQQQSDRRAEKLKYYEDSKDGIIHIPLRTPSDEVASPVAARPAGGEQHAPAAAGPRPASAPQPRAPRPPPPPSDRPASVSSMTTSRKPTQRTVLPDGSIIIPLRSPVEKLVDNVLTPNVPLSPVPNRSTAAAEPATPPGAPASEDRSAAVAEADGCEAGRGGTATVEAARGSDEEHRKRRERIVFTTNVGSREQVFSTQFSITKTPSVTSDMSESIPSFAEGGEPLAGVREVAEVAGETAGTRPPSPGRESSGEEADGGEEPARRGSEVERRGLVVQESFEEELPYVPTTLPLERSLALPMVPVRERSGVRVAGVQRPRAPRTPVEPAPPPPRAPPAPTGAGRAPVDKLRIKLPRRARTRTASACAPPRPERARTRSGGDEIHATTETRKKAEWIDFEEVPERRKQPKRIQTLPAAEPEPGGAAGAASGCAAGAGGPVYVEPEQCRCECHARRDDELPLLPAAHRTEQCGAASARVQLSVQLAQPARRRHAHRADHAGEPQ